jgi:hypothetical protein
MGRSESKERYRKVLADFVRVYCRKKHAPAAALGAPDALCPDCADLLAYATARLARCTHDPKPKCKDCTTHCYAPAYRARIQAVMRFSGVHFVKRGRLDWLVRYFLAK